MESWFGWVLRREWRREERQREREEALERSRNERKRKARERGREGEKERGHCGLRLKRSIQPFQYFCSSLPSLFSQTSQSVPRFSPFSIPFAGMPPSKNDPNGSRFPRVPPSYRRFTSLGDQPPPPVVSQAKVRGTGRKRKRKKNEARSISWKDLSTPFLRETRIFMGWIAIIIKFKRGGLKTESCFSKSVGIIYLAAMQFRLERERDTISIHIPFRAFAITPTVFTGKYSFYFF